MNKVLIDWLRRLVRFVRANASDPWPEPKPFVRHVPRDPNDWTDDHVPWRNLPPPPPDGFHVIVPMKRCRSHPRHLS